MIFSIDTPIKNLLLAKTPPSAFGEFVENTLPLAIFVVAMVAFLWAPAFLGM